MDKTKCQFYQPVNGKWQACDKTEELVPAWQLVHYSDYGMVSEGLYCHEHVEAMFAIRGDEFSTVEGEVVGYN